MGDQINNYLSQYHYTLLFQYSGLLARFTAKAMQIVRAMDPANELYYLRVSSKKNEILIAPDDNFTMVVMQNNVFLNQPEKEKPEPEHDVNFQLRT